MGCALAGNRAADHFALTKACKDLHDAKSMANAATVATGMVSTAKNIFPSAMAHGGSGPECHVPCLTDFIARTSGVK
ncbi:hypothetical protein [Tabrizicola sp. YIM 78059]|uniref:hypothetical protein n=1 Tax=Tabrizicola sp. YIM 78059 TaxID=2529861 RepID=UPI0010AA662D|nr:hypothetical protein [Tabrizicola sp. YIM 78059]